MREDKWTEEDTETEHNNCRKVMSMDLLESHRKLGGEETKCLTLRLFDHMILLCCALAPEKTAKKKRNS